MIYGDAIEVAVLAVSSELVSTANSLIHGRIQGNS